MRKPYVEVSGRKGLGVKADDLLDELESAARAEVDARHAGAPEAERARIAHAIAIGALRYFLLKYTRTAIIAFDFRDALDRKSTRLNSSHTVISYAVFCLKKK